MRPLKVTVRFEDRAFHAAVEHDTRVDHLLLKSLHHFGVDPDRKSHFHLRCSDVDRPEHALFLDRPIGDQVREGGELVLEPRTAEHRKLSTGSY